MKKIKELRRSKGVTQDKLSEHLGVARSTVSMWETDSCEPDSETISRIAEFFNTTTDYLLGRTDNPMPANEKPPAINDEGLKFALWGDKDVDDDILEDVKTYARIKREMDKQKKG